MKNELIKILESTGYNAYLQGSFTSDDDYPESFFTFWNNSTVSTSYFDNKEKALIWSFWLNFYSVNPELVDTVLLQVKTLLQANGWLVNGVGQDVASGRPDFTGRELEIIYIQRAIEPV